MADRTDSAQLATPWNKGKLIGRKPPLRLQEIWSVRTRLQMAGRTRELALLNLALDGKLRGCDLVRLPVRDLAHGESVLGRTSVRRQKVAEWVGLMLGDPPMYGAHSRRRTKAILIDQRTQNCRTLPLLLRQRQVERATGIKVPGMVERIKCEKIPKVGVWATERFPPPSARSAIRPPASGQNCRRHRSRPRRPPCPPPSPISSPRSSCRSTSAEAPTSCASRC